MYRVTRGSRILRPLVELASTKLDGMSTTENPNTSPKNSAIANFGIIIVVVIIAIVALRMLGGILSVILGVVVTVVVVGVVVLLISSLMKALRK